MKHLILAGVVGCVVLAFVVAALPYVENVQIEPDPEPITYLLPSELLFGNYPVNTTVHVEGYCWHASALNYVLVDAPGETIEMYATATTDAGIAEGDRVRAKVTSINPNSWSIDEVISSESW